MGSSKTRRKYGNDEKLAILKRHLVDREKVSDICDELKIHPNQFYRWQSELFTNGGDAFSVRKPSNKQNNVMKRLEDENQKLYKALSKKDNVIAEITEDYVRLKKNASELYGVNG